MKHTYKILIILMLLTSLTACTVSPVGNTPPTISPVQTATVEPAHTPSPEPAETPRITVPQTGYCISICRGYQYVLIEDEALAARLIKYNEQPETLLPAGAACPMDNHLSVYRDGVLAAEWIMAADGCRTVRKDDLYYEMPMDLYIDLYYAAFDRGFLMYFSGNLLGNYIYCCSRIAAFRLESGAFAEVWDSGSFDNNEWYKEITFLSAYTKAYYGLEPCEAEAVEFTGYMEVGWEEPDPDVDENYISTFKIWGNGSDYFMIEREDGTKETYRGEEMKDFFAGIYGE
jgi:hypothetical protein